MEVTTSKTVTLLMSEKEAEFLKDLTQNALLVNGFPAESEETTSIRESIFMALKLGLEHGS